MRPAVMDRATLGSQRSTQDTARRRHWLRALSASTGRAGRTAGGLLLLDTLCAIGFAGCLAAGLAALPQGLAAAAPWLGAGVAASLARGACAGGSLWMGEAASRHARRGARHEAVVACLGRAGSARRPIGELMAVAIDGVEATRGYVSRFVPARLAATAAPLLVLAATAAASPVSALLLAATLVPFTALMALAGGAAADQSRRQFAAHARLSGLFADRLRALPVVLAFQAQRRETQRLARAADDLRRRTLLVLRVAFVSSAGLELFAALSVALVAVYVGFNLLGLLPFPSPEHLQLRGAVFVLALAPEFYAPMRRLAAAYHDRQSAETAADQLIALQSECRPVAKAEPVAAPPVIRFEAVSVRYPHEERSALAEFDLLAKPGEITALLGPSGSGKTSALALLVGLAPLAGGEVWIDERPLSGLGSIARSVGWMGQAPLIRPASIAENIALARRDATRPEIAAAAALAGLAPLLRDRPGGLDARLDERGSGLSGGERRRIGLARVLVSRAPVLLLDEPTAHLDPESETALLAAILEVARGRTTIIATHSPEVAAIADRVVRIGR